MPKYKLDYIWLDGYTPVPNLRTKNLVKEFDSFPTVEELPLWGFDGSSTQQAEGGDSDCVLKPVAIYPDKTNEFGVLVLCEVMLPGGEAHPSNARATITDDPGTWFGFEQEYFLTHDGMPLGFPRNGYPEPRGPYYCGVGYKNVGSLGRKITEEHIAVYGPDNDQRLTGLHETQSIDKFSWGVADRGASVRVPHSFVKNEYRGYLEDRRPNSQGDPYAIASRILQTIATVPTNGAMAAV